MLLNINQLLVQRYAGDIHRTIAVLPDYGNTEFTVTIVLIRCHISGTTYSNNQFSFQSITLLPSAANINIKINTSWHRPMMSVVPFPGVMMIPAMIPAFSTARKNKS